MASTTMTVYLSVQRHETLADTCPDCLFSAIERFTFAILRPDGVSSYTRDICVVCKKREQGDG